MSKQPKFNSSIDYWNHRKANSKKNKGKGKKK